jgi:hypothetical protein
MSILPPPPPTDDNALSGFAELDSFFKSLDAATIGIPYAEKLSQLQKQAEAMRLEEEAAIEALIAANKLDEPMEKPPMPMEKPPTEDEPMEKPPTEDEPMEKPPTEDVPMEKPSTKDEKADEGIEIIGEILTNIPVITL